MMKPNHPYVLLSPVQAGRTMALMAMLLTFLPLRGLSQAANVLDWQSCVKEAAKNNPELVSAWEQIRQAEADKKITDSGRMPSVSASADAGRSKSSSSDASDSYRCP